MSDFAEVFASARILVWAEIETLSGLEKIGNEVEGGDIVSVSATFALNTIPTAIVVLATGVNVFNNKPATIHSLKDKLRPRDKVRVYAKILPGDAGRPIKIQPGTYMIFDGYLAGIGYQRSHNHANYVLNLIHWLDDLNNSSAINGDWLPGAPSSLARAALVARAAGPSSGIVAADIAPIPTVARDVATPTKLESDLWQDSLKPACLSLTTFPTWTGAPAGVSAEEFTNKAAEDALNRMPGEGLAYYKALAFNLFEGTALKTIANTSQSIADYYRRVFGDSTSQNSFWAKIITEFAAEFMFAISPAVRWALPIPFCGGVIWDPAAAWDAPVAGDSSGKATIFADEYSYAHFNTNMAQLLEAVYVAYPTQSGSGISAESATATPQSRLSTLTSYGRWPDDATVKSTLSAAERKRGVKLFKLPPRWLTNFAGDDLNALNTVLFGTVTPSAAAASASAGRAPAIAPSADAYEALRRPINKFARHWYLDEILQQRTGELSGILRFDIAPGSIVKIETPARDVLPVTVPLLVQDHIIAAVTSVSYVINAEHATAGTSFTFAHARTPAESRAGSLYATEKPPLYNNKFISAPLAAAE